MHVDFCLHDRLDLSDYTNSRGSCLMLNNEFLLMHVDLCSHDRLGTLMIILTRVEILKFDIVQAVSPCKYDTR